MRVASNEVGRGCAPERRPPRFIFLSQNGRNNGSSEPPGYMASDAPVLTQGDAEAQEPAARTARSRLQLVLHAQRDPLRDEIREVDRGLSLADTQTGRYGRLYSRRRLCASRGADTRLLLRILLERVLLATSASPRGKSLIPIPVPVQYRLSRCLE
jgi:hypothetical protein